MRHAIPVATLVLGEILMVAFGGMLMYQLASGNIIKRQAVRREGPGGCWGRSRCNFFCSWLLRSACSTPFLGLKR